MTAYEVVVAIVALAIALCKAVVASMAVCGTASLVQMFYVYGLFEARCYSEHLRHVPSVVSGHSGKMLLEPCKGW